MTTQHQMDRLKILGDPHAFVSSLCESDREAVRAAVEEIEGLKRELGEWWRAAVALNEATEDEAESKALAWLNNLRTGSSWCHIPEPVVKLVMEREERTEAMRKSAVAEIERLRTALARIVGLKENAFEHDCEVFGDFLIEIESTAKYALGEQP